MELCVAIEGQEGVAWEEWLALAEACERWSVPTLYCSDHYLSTAGVSERSALDAWGTLCALAARTSRLRLGTLVSPATFRHPSVLAKLAITADHVSGGRVELGLGAGWHEAEHRAFGFPFGDSATRMDRFDEQVQIVRGLLSGEPFSHSGPRYAYAGVEARPKPVRGPIRLLLGGSAGPRAARIAARWADEYNTGAVDAEECRRRRARLDAACEAVGRNPASLPLSVRMWLLTGRDEEELRARTRALARWRRAPAATPEDLWAELQQSRGWIIGTVEAAAERLRALRTAGAERFVLALALHRDLDQIRLVGRDLAGRVA
jgi:alkanesulfonate monooxygenase SsuD/methylene tetrahydromethanopterin reductase-like flavin-dependent oxidoreductase (luciferase family)